MAMQAPPPQGTANAKPRARHTAKTKRSAAGPRSPSPAAPAQAAKEEEEEAAEAAVAAPPPPTPSPAVVGGGLLAALVIVALLSGLGDNAPATNVAVDDGGEQLAALVADVRHTSWGEGTPLAKKLQHSLARQAKGSAVAEGARSFVVGGDRTTAADRAELVGLLAPWVRARSRCPAEAVDGWRVDVDGASLDARAAEALLARLADAQCATILVVVSNAQRVHIDVMQQFEPLLSGEGPALPTEPFLILDVETPSVVDGDGTLPCVEQRGTKRYNCMEQELQNWIRASVWKRRGLLGRITQWIPLG